MRNLAAVFRIHFHGPAHGPIPLLAYCRALLLVLSAGACGIAGAAPAPSPAAATRAAATAPGAAAPATAAAPSPAPPAAGAGAGAGAGAAAATTAATPPATAAAAEKPATPPASAPDSPACKNGSTSEQAYAALKNMPVTVARIRSVSRFRFLPLNTEADILAFTPPDQATTFHVIQLTTDANGNQLPSAINSDQVWTEPATQGAAGTDFQQSEEKSLKTMLHFTPEADDSWVFWQPARVYIIGCTASGAVKEYGQLSTNFSNQWFCITLAALMCVAFYVLAAFGTFYIHQAQRVHKSKTVSAQLGLRGTNYAPLRHHFNPVVLTAGSNGRGSATKLQILFFSLIVFGLVSYVWMSTGYLSDLSSTILLLMGISGLGATVSSATDVAKSRLDFDNWAWLINRHWLPKGGVAEANQAQWKDIVMTDGEFDVYRFQMITFSVLVGMALLGAGGRMADLSTFTIPTALLGILGLSQSIYIAGKLAAPPTITQLNDQIAKLRDAESGLQTALNKRDQTSNTPGLTALPLDRAELATRVGDAFDKYMAAWETARTMFESTLSREVSAVAAGYRPPFPYLRPPADVMQVLETKFDEVRKKAQTSKAKLEAQPAAASVSTQIDALADALSACDSALGSAQASVANFEKKVKESENQADDASPSVLDLAAKDKATSELAARNALELLRQRLDQLDALSDQK